MRGIVRVAVAMLVYTLSLAADAAPDFAPAVFYSAGQFQEGVAAGDLDGDGDSDLAVLDGARALRVLFNDGSGAFPTSTTYADLWSGNTSDIAMADLDRDGDNDLAVAFFTIYGAVSILLNHGDGSFAAPVDHDTCYSTQAVVIADLNGDGYRDTASASNCFKASILLNDGHGSFVDNGDWGAGYVPSGIDTGDLDGDGDREIAYTNGTNSITLLFNDGAGSFPVMGGVGSSDQPRDVRIADLDGDGDDDLTSTITYSDDLAVYLNDGGGSLSAPVKYSLDNAPDKMDAADLDLDGDVDFVVANRSGTVSFAINNGSGAFTTRLDRAAGTGPEDVTAADLNGDARPDVVASHWDSGRVAVYLNTTSAAPDLDDDGVTDANDCAPGNRAAWALTSAVSDLLVGGATTALSWSAPDRPGAPVPRYDLLRATAPAAFQQAECVVSDATSRAVTDPSVPDPGAAFYYLVRARNACGGNLGVASETTQRQGTSCPSGS